MDLVAELQQKDPSSLWHTLRRMIAARKEHPSVGWGDFTWIESGSQAVAAFWRTHQQERVLCLANLSNSAQVAQLNLPLGIETVGKDLLTGTFLMSEINQDTLVLPLQPFQYYWLDCSSYS